jgi:hypothetical protein
MADEPQTVRIENIDERERVTHRCTSTNLLTEIQVSIAKLEAAITSMAAASQELNARFEEQNREFRQFMQTGHICKYAAQIELLMNERHKKLGSDYWVEKFVESIKYLVLFVAGMFLTFILKGGHL